ncbi:MAG: hypothetical protein R3267_04035 [Paenisporosarcina sp.]|nr:hypothetical protein [Paenisporosarcina sp.]
MAKPNKLIAKPKKVVAKPNKSLVKPNQPFPTAAKRKLNQISPSN